MTATLARMERGEQPIPVPDYRAIVTALAVDPLQAKAALDPLERIAAGVKMNAAAADRRRRPAA